MIETVPLRGGPLARFGRRHPVIVDVLVGISWLLLGGASLAVDSVVLAIGPIGVVGASILVLGVAAALVVFRRYRPVVAFVIVFAITVPLALIEPVYTTLGVGFAVFAIAVYDSIRRAWLATAGCAAYIAALCGFHALIGIPSWVDPADTRINTALIQGLGSASILLIAVAWGQNAGGRKRYIDDLIEHARAVERERDQQVQLAALAERSRIARDMHDVVAHSLSVIVRLADGARAVFDQRPARSREAIEQVAEVGRQSLTEMRRVIGMLDATPGEVHVPDQVGFGDLERLAEVYRGVGLPVSLERHGPALANAGVQLTVFRVIQEALTNALRHATAPTLVAVSVECDKDVTVSIRNDGAFDKAGDGHSGRGLVGMRERAALYQGALTAGPVGDGEWLVRMTLPGAGR